MSELSYEMCVALKGAGFPQPADDSGWWIRSDGKIDSVPIAHDDVACPNSDDLLAALQAEWPEHAIKVACRPSVGENVDQSDPGAQAYVYVPGESDKLQRTEYGDRPVTALANLYIALKETANGIQEG